jgi:hypothetical protein
LGKHRGQPDTLHSQIKAGTTYTQNCTGKDLANQANGKLNPRWVETLMGLPVGWVMPSCVSPVIIEPTSCDCSETESFPPPQSELFEFSQGGS